MKLVEVPIEQAVDGEEYLTKMKHGWISGAWDSKEKTCNGYYWRDMSWYVDKLYKVIDADGRDVS